MELGLVATKDNNTHSKDSFFHLSTFEFPGSTTVSADLHQCDTTSLMNPWVASQTLQPCSATVSHQNTHLVPFEISAPQTAPGGDTHAVPQWRQTHGKLGVRRLPPPVVSCSTQGTDKDDHTVQTKIQTVELRNTFENFPGQFVKVKPKNWAASAEMYCVGLWVCVCVRGWVFGSLIGDHLHYTCGDLS